MMSVVLVVIVVVINLIYYVVVLKYEDGMGVFLCLVKGIDVLVLKIRDVVKENEVLVVENLLLVWVFYVIVDIDGEVLEEYYKVVVEVIGFVFCMCKWFFWWVI